MILYYVLVILYIIYIGGVGYDAGGYIVGGVAGVIYYYIVAGGVTSCSVGVVGVGGSVGVVGVVGVGCNL